MGPLKGVKVIEVGGVGPGPFCCMMLSDLGAEVVRIDRTDGYSPTPISDSRYDVLLRNRRSVAMDLKNPASIEAVLRLVRRAHVLVEGYRPGVMERFGLGPETCLERNPSLVYGRMTGWGQKGPWAAAAGHDINYIGLTGALNAIGPAGQAPVPPLNIVGDYGGGGMMLAFGLVCALLEARNSGKGQVVDAAMVDGAALLMAATYGYHAMDYWTNERGSNLLDGGAHFYGVYQCADGRYVAIGAIEPAFYGRFLSLCGIDDPECRSQDRQHWRNLRAKLEAVFRTRSREEWCSVFDGSDACVTPVLDLDEAPAHPHNRARQAFIEVAGVKQPAPAPRFTRTPAATPTPAPNPGRDTRAVLSEWGFSSEEIGALLAIKAIT